MPTTPPVEHEPSRVQRKRSRRMQEILAVAAQLFGERGYEAVTVEEVAARLDVTKGSIYYYFPSKDELGTAAIETLGDDWTARLERLPAGRDGRPGARLRALITEQVTIAVRDYPAALGLFLVPQEMPEPQRARIKELRRRHDQVFRAVIEEGVASGGVHGDLGRHRVALHARGDEPGPGLVRRPARSAAGRGRRRAHRHADDVGRRAAETLVRCGPPVGMGVSAVSPVIRQR